MQLDALRKPDLAPAMAQYRSVLNRIAGAGGSHGDDERIMQSSLLTLIQFLWYAVIEVAATAA